MPRRHYACPHPACDHEVTVWAGMHDPEPTCTGTGEDPHEPTDMEITFKQAPEINVKGGTPRFHG